MAGRKTPLQGKYQGSLTELRPHFIDEMGWELFKAHIQEGRSLVQLALEYKLSVFKVREIVWRVDRDLQLARPNEPGCNEVVDGSPLEDLNLSTRARNALREMGFDTVRSLLERDFTLVCRRLGRIGKEEILSALSAHGFHRLTGSGSDPDSNIEQVRRHVAMLRAHIERSHQKWLRRVERIENRLRATNRN